MTRHDVQMRMGTEATEAEAEAMLELLEGQNPSDIGEDRWARVLIPRAIRLAAKRAQAPIQPLAEEVTLVPAFIVCRPSMVDAMARARSLAASVNDVADSSPELVVDECRRPVVVTIGPGEGLPKTILVDDVSRDELVKAAQAVVEAWAGGDLLGAIKRLDGWLKEVLR